MFVVVALMGGVTTTVMDVVHVVAVRDGDMPTPLGMHVVMPLMNAVLADLTLVVVAIVGFVQVSIVDIVDMVAVRDGDMPTHGRGHGQRALCAPLSFGSFLSQSSGQPVQLPISSHIR